MPPHGSDTRAAWTGAAPGRAGVPLRVEAAAYRGKPAYFQLVWPWTRPQRMQPYPITAQQRVGVTVLLALFLAVLIGAVFLARRNLRLGRGDRRGAFRLAVFVLVILMLAWGITAHHLPTPDEFELFVLGASFALFIGAFVWLLYIGLEPYVRRRWPNSIISWSRVLAGQFRDPLVGRDVLIGVTLGVGMGLMELLENFAEGWFGRLPPEPMTPHLNPLLGAREMIGQSFWMISSELSAALAFFFLLFLLRLLLRKDWLAAAVFVLIFVAIFPLTGNYPLVDAVFVAVMFGSLVFVLMRFGLFPLVAFFIASDALSDFFPQTTHLSAWYAGSTYLSILLVLALAIYGFRVSLAGRPVFSGAALDE
jgi:serine/threonine-protein kinase